MRRGSVVLDDGTELEAIQTEPGELQSGAGFDISRNGAPAGFAVWNERGHLEGPLLDSDPERSRWIYGQLEGALRQFRPF